MILLSKNTTFVPVEKMNVQPNLSKSSTKPQQKDSHVVSSRGTMRIGPEFKSRISVHEGKILALATRNVVTLPPTATIMEAIKIMTERRFRRIPIADAGTGRLEGVITTVDIIDFLGGGKRNLLVKTASKAIFWLQ